MSASAIAPTRRSFLSAISKTIGAFSVAAVSMQVVAPAPATAATPALQPVSPAMVLEHQRAACHAQMVAVIRAAKRDGRTVCLNSSIFDAGEAAVRFAKCDNAVKIEEASSERNTDVLNVMYAIHKSLKLHLEVANHLREIRVPVAHADPEDYWEDREWEWRNGYGFTRMAGEA